MSSAVADQWLKDLGFKADPAGRLEDTIAKGHNVTFAAEMMFDIIVLRAIAQIAFNYVLSAPVRNGSYRSVATP